MGTRALPSAPRTRPALGVLRAGAMKISLDSLLTESVFLYPLP